MKTITTSTNVYDSDGRQIKRVDSYKVKKNGEPYQIPFKTVAFSGDIRVKCCTKCGSYKPINEFRTYTKNIDKKFSHCRTCENKYFNKYDRSEKGKKRFKRRAWLEDNVIKADTAYYSYVKDYFNNACALTGDSSEPIVFDHVLPLAWGCVGNEMGNLLPVTVTLNKVKRTKNILEIVSMLTDEQQYNFYQRVLPWLANENDMDVQEYTKLINEMEKHKI